MNNKIYKIIYLGMAVIFIITDTFIFKLSEAITNLIVMSFFVVSTIHHFKSPDYKYGDIIKKAIKNRKK